MLMTKSLLSIIYHSHIYIYIYMYFFFFYLHYCVYAYTVTMHFFQGDRDESVFLSNFDV